jgi:hypothetical protein
MINWMFEDIACPVDDMKIKDAWLRWRKDGIGTGLGRVHDTRERRGKDEVGRGVLGDTASCLYHSLAARRLTASGDKWWRGSAKAA